ncbi:class I SAM-dependent methyltransferase [Leptospira levettii]|uniref:class I SAM-dependent methyltransferase n=1 Tax=Leptospira levettii TaxID=2023178 RepID=UPI00223CB822|nr:class I SAM-dependent methyltransferase [Leptospira levettii]MCW7497034.1 class I SAM-dependent methyltransferase [Leptospira levettii]
MDEIRFLDASLLEDINVLAELNHWLLVMDRPNGWHYDLDHIWILQELKKANILPGSTILDAGAGQGIMQFLLASRGYNVISLDFSSRLPPKRSKGIFKIIGEGNSEINYKHPYMNFIKYNSNKVSNLMSKFKFEKILKIIEIPFRVYRSARSYSEFMLERFFKKHDHYGTIRFLRAPFHDVPLESEIAHAVISVSAIEHADINLFKGNIESLFRLVKPDGKMLITTSATAKEENEYDDKVSGFCFSKKFLSQSFPQCKLNFDYDSCLTSLFASQTFFDRIDSYYYLDKNSPFYKKNIVKFPYLPIGIKLNK